MLVPTGVRYVSVAAKTGHGDSAEQYISGLRARVPVTWTPTEVRDGDAALGAHADIRDADIPYDTVVLHLRPSELGPWVDAERDRVRVAYVPWESSKAPDTWKDVLDQVHLVLVPSEFNRRVIVDTGTSAPVAVLPHIARRVTPVPGGDFGDVAEKDFVFYAIGPWYNRKAVEDTVRAFLDAFTAEDDVALVVKTSVVDYSAAAALKRGEILEGRSKAAYTWWTVARMLRGRPRPPKLFLEIGDVPAERIDEIHTRGDCYVSLARGEGWGLAAFDAALFGNPSIVTGWGGHLDYLGSDYPYLVDYELVPTTTDPPDAFGFPLSDESHWARAHTSHASALMRQVYEDRKEAAAVGLASRGRLRDKYASAVVTSRFISLLADAHESVTP